MPWLFAEGATHDTIEVRVHARAWAGIGRVGAAYSDRARGQPWGRFFHVAMDGKCHRALKGNWYSEYLLERSAAAPTECFALRCVHQCTPTATRQVEPAAAAQ